MKIEPYNYFFHPCHEDHSTVVKVVAVITALALSILTLGLYLGIFLCVRGLEEGSLKEKKVKVISKTPPKKRIAPKKVSAGPSSQGVILTPKAALIKSKHAESLALIKRLSREVGGWKKISDHRNPGAIGYDWWLFPIDRSSSYGMTYAVDEADIAALKSHQAFMESYREGVIWVTRSWGWNVVTGHDETCPERMWSDYQVRLGKMLCSLKLFGEVALHQKVVAFANKHVVNKQDWVVQACVL